MNGKLDTFEFNCHVNFDPSRLDVGFDVTWLFDGKPDPNVPRGHVIGSDRNSDLDQKFLVGHLGETVCTVSALHYVNSCM